MQHYTICVYAIPFDITLSHFMQRHTICVYAVPFNITLSHLVQRYTVYMYTVPFKITLNHFMQRYAKLFSIELVHFTSSSSNSTWATRLFIIWLNYSCLGCSVSWRKSKLSIIWPCHSFISYAVLQLILKPALFLLIYLTSWYFWWWWPPIMMTKPQSQIPY